MEFQAAGNGGASDRFAKEQPFRAVDQRVGTQGRLEIERGFRLRGENRARHEMLRSKLIREPVQALKRELFMFPYKAMRTRLLRRGYALLYGRGARH